MNSDTYFKYFYYHTKHILKMKLHMKNFCKYIMGAGRSPANYGFGHLPDFEKNIYRTLRSIIFGTSITLSDLLLPAP